MLHLFLDYDGTLTSIVSRPELALLTAENRHALARLASRWPTAIVSGRARAEIQQLVGIPELAYVGAHGFDIQLPGSAPMQPLPHARAHIQNAFAAIAPELSRIGGVIVENKEFAIAVHFRLASESAVPHILQIVDGYVAQDATLRRTRGKEIVEIRPNIDWDKGSAIRWLNDHWSANGLPLFIGDDTTDEDGFRAIADDGIAIVVAEQPVETHARYSLRDVREVYALLYRLIDLPPRDRG